MHVQRGYLAALRETLSEGNPHGQGVQMLPAGQISPNEQNFYDVSDVDALVDSILLDGLQSPIVVQARKEMDFVIISGHRRFAALAKIRDEGLVIAEGKLFATEIHAGLVPCLINVYKNAYQAELALIRANSDTRVLSSAEIAKQAERVEELLYRMKEEGYTFPGRMRDYVAEVCQVSASKLARLKVIREGLTPKFTKLFQKGDLRESVAYALARLTQEQQGKIYTYKSEQKQLAYLYEHEVERLGKALGELDTARCKRAKGVPCENRDRRWCSYIASPYAYKPCSSTCCAKCSQLESCKFACEKLAEEIKSLRTDAKAKKAQVRLEQQERDAPDIAAIQAIWMRFGEARRQANCSVPEVFTLLNRYYGDDAETRFCALEEGTAKWRPDSDLPFGYGFRLSDVKKLCAAADRFGCSVDFLLGRTDVPQRGPSVLTKEEEGE